MITTDNVDIKSRSLFVFPIPKLQILCLYAKPDCPFNKYYNKMLGGS